MFRAMSVSSSDIFWKKKTPKEFSNNGLSAWQAVFRYQNWKNPEFGVFLSWKIPENGLFLSWKIPENRGKNDWKIPETPYLKEKKTSISPGF